MYKKNNRILILIPGPEARGGITAYYKALTPLFSLPVDYMRRGSRKWPQKDKFFFELLRIIKDLFRFWRLVRKKEYSLVLTNTSFSSQAILRDGFFLIIARFYKIRTVVFFHGWDYEFAKKIERKYFKIFKQVFFKADALIDLAQRNINQLRDWGYNKKIFLETTVVDKDLINEVDEEKIIKKYTSKTYNILFLARLEKTKGIYEAIETFTVLKKNTQ